MIIILTKYFKEFTEKKLENNITFRRYPITNRDENHY